MESTVGINPYVHAFSLAHPPMHTNKYHMFTYTNEIKMHANQHSHIDASWCGEKLILTVGQTFHGQ